MTVLGMMMGRKPAGGGGGLSSPLDLTWANAYWAEDPGWTNPGDGNAVATWDDAGTQAVDLAQGTAGNRPLYEATYTSLNNQPAIVWDGAAADWLDTSGAPSISQPYTLVVVAFQAASGASESGIWDSPAGEADRAIFRPRSNSGTQLLMNAGTTQRFGNDIDGAAFMAVTVYNGASSECEINTAAQTIGGTVGTNAYGDIRIGIDNAGGVNTRFTGAIAFLGRVAGVMSAQDRQDLWDWASAHYGIT